MNRLTVLYDGCCGFCRRCRWWLEDQPKYVELEYMPMKSPEVERRFPGVARPGAPEELIVISDEGGVYRGAEAWIMCLYALRDYREWSDLLAQPALLPLARGAFGLLSDNRRTLSRWLGLEGKEALVQALQEAVPVAESCDVGPPGRADTARTPAD